MSYKIYFGMDNTVIEEPKTLWKVTVNKYGEDVLDIHIAKEATYFLIEDSMTIEKECDDIDYINTILREVKDITGVDLKIQLNEMTISDIEKKLKIPKGTLRIKD